MEITRALFMKALEQAAYAGATRALAEAGLTKAFISKNKAEKRYGKGVIRIMIEEGLLNPIKEGVNTSTIKISVTELSAAAIILNINY